MTHNIILAMCRCKMYTYTFLCCKMKVQSDINMFQEAFIRNKLVNSSNTKKKKLYSVDKLDIWIFGLTRHWHARTDNLVQKCYLFIDMFVLIIWYRNAISSLTYLYWKFGTGMLFLHCHACIDNTIYCILEVFYLWGSVKISGTHELPSAHCYHQAWQACPQKGGGLSFEWNRVYTKTQEEKILLVGLSLTCNILSSMLPESNSLLQRKIWKAQPHDYLYVIFLK